MGYASTKEDIERIAEELRHLREEAAGDSLTATDIAARQGAFRRLCSDLAARVDALLELATDPDIRLAEQLKSEVQRANDLHAENLKHRARARELEAAAQATDQAHRRRVRALEAEAARWRAEAGRLRADLELEHKGMVDFGAVVDAFPPGRSAARSSSRPPPEKSRAGQPSAVNQDGRPPGAGRPTRG